MSTADAIALDLSECQWHRNGSKSEGGGGTEKCIHKWVWQIPKI